MWYLLILASICLLLNKPKEQRGLPDRFFTTCVRSEYQHIAYTEDLETAYLPTGHRKPVIYPPGVVMYVMAVKEIEGEVFLKVSAQTTAGYECVGWIKKLSL